MSRANLFVLGQFILLAIFAGGLLLLPLTSSSTSLVVAGMLVLAGAVVGLLGMVEHWRRNKTIPYITPKPNASVGLVDSGIYRYIRHPLYTGVLLGALGVAIGHGHALVLVIALLLVVFFAVKARFEEKLLRQTYPTYAEYMTRTGRFIPYVNVF